ncbi:MAG: hypothetical protein GEU79_10640 [Acidimicrobiia bacterium]|nr:hypothetical protein [Acidimicrobiia bacterium]
MRYRKVPATILVLLCLVLAIPVMGLPEGNDRIRITQSLDWIADNYESAASENPGFYADTIFALASSPGYDDTVEQAAESLIASTGYYGNEAEVVPPALAKTVFALQLAGVDPTDVNGRDLLAELQETIVREGPDAGRIGAIDDVYASTFAIMAFAVAAIDEPMTVDWLVDQQCPSGAFSYNGTCEGDEEFFGVDPDSTVIAAHGLETRPEAANKALAWVADQQDPDTGGFAAYGTLNANSTGMGGLGMGLFDQEDAAASAIEFLVGLQFGADSEPQNRGGIPFQARDAQPDFFATVQAVLARVDEGLLDLVDSRIDQRHHFEDVDAEDVFAADIGWLHHVGVTQGCDPGDDQPVFCPDRALTRGEMAAFMNRALALPQGDGSEFTDIDDDHLFADDIVRVTAAGITLGCNPPSEFCPGETLTRGELATVLSSALDLTETAQHGFTDVADDAPYAEDVERLAAAGISSGCNPPDNTEFCPDREVSRQEVAALLHRVFR